MSNADLSREIAQLVSRAVAGEAIDPVAAGQSLARRFPHLFLSGELISKAIARAASMVGVELKGAEHAVTPPAYQASDAALWYFQPAAAAPSKPGLATRGWFAPPKAGSIAPNPGPEQMILQGQQGMHAT